MESFVYVGNVHDSEGQTTFCPDCETPLIRRDWHAVLESRLEGDRCPGCGQSIPGIFAHGGPLVPTGQDRYVPGE